MSERVFVLGAGFSRAISPEMPLMSELSAAVRKYLARFATSLPPSVDRFGDNLEQWLSYLADRQPWLDEPTILRNRAAFAEVSNAIAEVLGERQFAAVRSSPPPWLETLVAYWSRMNSTVISFNYDTLVEAVAIEQIGSKHGWAHLYPTPTVPAAARVGMVIGGNWDVEGGFKLLKLHGSLTWFWSGLESAPNDSVYDVGLRGGWSVEGLQSKYDDKLPILVRDKVPMVVPPTATKSRFYENATLRSLWASAGEALRNAEEVVLIGYSLPPSDTVVRTMLATTFNGTAVLPVNTRDDVVAHLRDLFDDEALVVDHYAGREEAIDDFVTMHCG